jgi:hypothetical protein
VWVGFKLHEQSGGVVAAVGGGEHEELLREGERERERERGRVEAWSECYKGTIRVL